MSSEGGSSPQEIKRYSNKLILALALVGALFVILGIYARANIKAGNEAKDPLKVTVVTVEEQAQYRVPRWFAGRIEARQQVEIASELAGKVVEIHVDEGDRVEAGEILVSLDTELLAATKMQLQARLTGIDAELKLADLRLQRQSDLKAKGFSAEDTIDEIETLITRLQADRLALVKQIDEVEIRLQKSLIRAPFTASVQTRLLDSGAVIAAGTPLISLFERGATEIKVGVPREVAAKLTIGEVRPVKAAGRDLSAVVLSIAPAVDLATQTVAVRLQIQSEEAEAIKIGEYVRLRFDASFDRAGFWIPNSALIEGERGLWNIYSLDKEDVVQKHAIEVLFADNEKAFVSASIEDRARVVSSGLHRVTPGMTVSVE